MSRETFNAVAIRALAVVCLASLSSELSGVTVEPSLAPQITSMFPRGGRQGTAFEVKISGSNLDRADRIEFTSHAVRARITSSRSRQILANVEVDSQAEPGTHEFRLFTPNGTAIGVFSVGTLPEITESEPNNGIRSAQAIQYPILINGTATAEDADLYRFHARADQKLTFDIAAARNGSPLDPVLAVLDENGREIAFCDDYYIEKDSHIEYTFSVEGDYTVRVTASYSRSTAGADYRLSVTDRAYPIYSIPAGAQHGAKVQLTLRGSNIQDLDHVWLDTAALPANVVKRSPSELTIAVEIPASATTGRHRMHFAAGKELAANSLNFEISDSPEVTISDAAARSPLSPVRINTPVIVNSEIGEHGVGSLSRVHIYEFDAPEGGRYELQVKAWELGLRTDPVITLFDTDGKKLAIEDDPAPNSFIHYAATHDPTIVYKFAKAGRYRIVIRDAMYRGGPGFIYRLAVRPVRPDYYVEVVRPQITAYVGRKTTMLANVHRTGGVHIVEMFKHPDNEIENFRIREIDGWKSNILVRAEDVPPGVTAEPVIAEPKNTTFKGNDGEDLFVDGTVVDVPLQIAAIAQPGTYKIRIRAESTFDERTLARNGRVVRKNRTVKIDPEQESVIYLTIVKPPPVLLIPPESLDVSEGEVSQLKLSLFFFEQSQGPLILEARTKTEGLTVGSVTVPSSREGIEMPVSATTGARDPVQVILVARDVASGRILSESPPVNVRIAGKATPGAFVRGVN